MAPDAARIAARLVRDDGRVSPEPNQPPDPFGTDGPGGRPASDELDEKVARVQAIRLSVVALVAVVASFVAPPVGALLGVVAIVRAVRSRGTASARTRGLVIAAGTLAALVGVVATSMLLVFRVEVSDYRQCLAGANTQQARDNCTSALNDAVTTRLGLTSTAR